MFAKLISKYHFHYASSLVKCRLHLPILTLFVFSTKHSNIETLYHKHTVACCEALTLLDI